jgi:hypothetical protein
MAGPALSVNAARDGRGEELLASRSLAIVS